MKKTIYELIKNNPNGMTWEEVSQAIGLSMWKTRGFLMILTNTLEVLEIKNNKFFIKKSY